MIVRSLEDLCRTILGDLICRVISIIVEIITLVLTVVTIASMSAKAWMKIRSVLATGQLNAFRIPRRLGLFAFAIYVIVIVGLSLLWYGWVVVSVARLINGDAGTAEMVTGLVIVVGSTISIAVKFVMTREYRTYLVPFVYLYACLTALPFTRRSLDIGLLGVSVIVMLVISLFVVLPISMGALPVAVNRRD